MTPKQEELKRRIERAKIALEEAKDRYWQLRYECPHVYEQNDESAKCAVCGDDGGWWCPESPNHTCHYSRGEWCDFCGKPDERK